MFIEVLREERESCGVTQEKLAESLNCTQSVVSKCERGERRLDVVELHSWCKALGIRFPSFITKLDKALSAD